MSLDVPFTVKIFSSLSFGLVAFFITQSVSIIWVLISSDSKISSSASSTGQPSIISLSKELTSSNFLLNELAIIFKRSSSICSTLIIVSVSLISLVITLRFPSHLAQRRGVFSLSIPLLYDVTAPRWASFHKMEEIAMKPRDISNTMFSFIPKDHTIAQLNYYTETLYL